MIKDVRVSVIGKQYDSATSSVDEAEVTEVVVVGRCHERDGNIFISYDEHHEDFPKPVKVLIKLSEDTFTVTKKGDISMIICYDPAIPQHSKVVMPYGAIDMCIKTEAYTKTRTIDHKTGKETVKAAATYTIDYGGNYILSNELTVIAEEI